MTAEIITLADYRPRMMSAPAVDAPMLCPDGAAAIVTANRISVAALRRCRKLEGDMALSVLNKAIAELAGIYAAHPLEAIGVRTRDLACRRNRIVAQRPKMGA